MGRASRKKKKKKGQGETSAYEGMVILNITSRALEVAYPESWSAEPDPRGYFRIEDPEENATLELSALWLPPGPLPPDLPSAAEQLAETVSDRARTRDSQAEAYVYHERPEDVVIHQRPHFGNDMAWCDYTYDAPDRSRGNQVRLAHGRYLIATNRAVQTLWTYYYWHDYCEYATYWWERMVVTLHIGQPGKPTGILEAAIRPKN